MLLTLTHSAIETFQRCPFSYWLGYVQQIVRAGDDEARATGTGLHSYAEAEDKGEAQPPPATDKRSAIVRAMCAGWSAHIEPLSTIPEVAFEVRVPGLRGVRLAGKPDGVSQGREIKTTSDDIETARQAHTNSLQIPTYQLMFPEPFRLDIVKKPTIQMRKEEEPADFCERAIAEYNNDPQRFFSSSWVEYDKERCSQALERIRWAARTIRKCHKEKHWQKRSGFGCRNEYRIWCDYRALCWYNDVDSYRRKTKEHEEL